MNEADTLPAFAETVRSRQRELSAMSIAGPDTQSVRELRSLPTRVQIHAMQLPAVLVIAAVSLSFACIVAAPRVSFDETLAQMSSVRGLDSRLPIHHHDLSRDEMLERYSEFTKQDWKRYEGWRYEKAMVALGVWPPDREMFNDFAEGRDSALGGFYVSETRSVYTPTDDYDAGELSFYDLLLGRDASHQFTLAHEILHALQAEAYPEYFDTASQLGQDDLAMALHAAKEGDASYFAGAVLEGLPTNGPGMLSDERVLLIDPKEFFPNDPLLVGYTQMFPYAFGYRLARNEGKRLLERPPVSTEQVIHLGKRRESFLVMDLGALESMLPNGCRSVTQNTLGEFGILILFHELGAALPAATWTQIAPDYFREAERFGLDSRDLSDSIPETIWEGWDGDRYFVAECGSDLEFIWITAWDSEGDAREFQAGYRVVATELATRNERSDPPRVRLRGRRVIVTTEGLSEISAGLDSRVREKRVSDLASLRVHMLGRAASGGEGTATVPP